MRLAVPLILAALAITGVARAVPSPSVHQAVVDGESIPTKLSAFGLFADNDPARPVASFAYTLRTPLFSDYADKRRLVALPPGQRAVVGDDGNVQFPVGTVLVKSFGWADVNGGRPIETRLLVYRSAGWVALPYVWDADGRDATLKVAGARVPVSFRAPNGQMRTISYAVPNKNQCKECHGRSGAIAPIGPKARNMITEGADRHFSGGAVPKPTLPRWDDASSGTIAERARAYLDVNCAHCHNPQGSASNSGLFLGWDVSDAKMIGVGKRPVAAGHGSGGRDFAVAPGDPDASILLYRMESVEPGVAMPEVGRGTVHREGAALVREWIAQMPRAAH